MSTRVAEWLTQIYKSTSTLNIWQSVVIITRIRSVERGICPIAADCMVLLSWSRDPGHANVSKTFVRGHVATIPGTCLSNLKFVPLAVLELLAFNAQKFTGVTWPWPCPHRKLLSGVMWELSPGTHLPNLKCVSSAVLELLAFNAQKFKGQIWSLYLQLFWSY